MFSFIKRVGIDHFLWFQDGSCKELKISKDFKKPCKSKSATFIKEYLIFNIFSTPPIRFIKKNKNKNKKTKTKTKKRMQHTCVGILFKRYAYMQDCMQYVMLMLLLLYTFKRSVTVNVMKYIDKFLCQYFCANRS